MKGAGAGSGRTAGAGLSLLLRAHKGATIAFVVVLIVALFAAQTERDSMGIEVWREGEALHYAYRVAILAAPLG